MSRKKPQEAPKAMRKPAPPPPEPRLEVRALEVTRSQGEYSITNIGDIRKRYDQFQAPGLPGQPPMMHMGTAYLMGDMYRVLKQQAQRIEELEAALEYLEEEAMRDWESPAELDDEGYPNLAAAVLHARAALATTRDSSRQEDK